MNKKQHARLVNKSRLTTVYYSCRYVDRTSPSIRRQRGDNTAPQTCKGGRAPARPYPNNEQSFYA
ncbi:hypothetical protein L484_013510 [Morus notabilis]|uniref:Uncharacterized protein n=1 Tax=Morus notabilis TaxID=981085 RepID=W9QXY7_9ROSA|nr:hypothetical protein L484_013510 [Morus notabilis]